VQSICAADCDAHSGTAVQRAETQGECMSLDRQGCFDLNMNMVTAVDKASCSDPNICDPDQFMWKPILEWTRGYWQPSAMVSDGISWSDRKLVPKNKWNRVISWETFSDVVYDAGYLFCLSAARISADGCSSHANLPFALSLSPLSDSFSPLPPLCRYSMAAEAFTTEFKCQMEPLHAILRTIGLLDLEPCASALCRGHTRQEVTFLSCSRDCTVNKQS
jgi:hypothetical protein